MRVSKRETLTFVALWALGAFLIVEVMGCTPSLQTNTGEETAQEEGEKKNRSRTCLWRTTQSGYTN